MKHTTATDRSRPHPDAAARRRASDAADQPRPRESSAFEEVEVLAIGAGPANLALGVAIEELAPAGMAASTLIVEQHTDVAWQRGMLLPWAQSQVSFLKDLVTRRNPRSRFSFVNYLHTIGRLDDFVNLGSFTPYRSEISDYLRWVADSFASVRVDFGRRCIAIEPCAAADGSVRAWRVSMADGSTIICHNLVIGIGREPHVPAAFAAVPRERLIHSTEFSSRLGGLDADRSLRVTVVGGAQSAAEMLWASYQQLPHATCTMVMRSIGLTTYENSRFTNELFFPSFVDEFHAAPAEARADLLRAMHRTNYSGLSPQMLETLYRAMYLERLDGRQRLTMRVSTEVLDARTVGDEVVLSLLDRTSGRTSEHRCDVVMLGTGFVRAMPTLIRDLATTVGLTDVSVDRFYRMALPPGHFAPCYLQGVNEATHGIADSLLSVLATRSAEILADILRQQLARERPAVSTSGATVHHPPAQTRSVSDGDPTTGSNQTAA